MTLAQHPRAIELVERAKLRKAVARAVSRLIAILDDLDGDPEAEPWLGASVVLHPAHNDQRLWACCANDDREQEDEHGGDILDGVDDDRVDNEPSLGALGRVERGWGGARAGIYRWRTMRRRGWRQRRDVTALPIMRELRAPDVVEVVLAAECAISAYTITRQMSL